MAAWIAPAIEAAGSVAGSVASGLFGNNQAAKNRSFQERMYYQQLEDNRENWQRVADYNLPSAELQRIKDAGLNPLLYYQNGSGAMAGSQITSASAPSGAQANANFGNPFNGFTQSLAQMRMLNAQIENINADTSAKEAQALQTESQTEWQNIENKFSKDTFELRKAIRHGDLETINQNLNNMRQDMLNGANLTSEQCMTLAQGRMYQRKEYSLHAEEVGNNILALWENVAIGKTNASAAVRQSFAAMMHARAAAQLSAAQVGQIAFDMGNAAKMFPYLMQEQQIKNRGFRLDNMIKSQEVGIKKLQKFQSAIESYYQYKGAPSGSFIQKFMSPFFAPQWNKNDAFRQIMKYGQ